MTKAVEDLLGELLDREAIQDLAKRYCKCLWESDADGFSRLFTEDGVFVRFDGERVSGRADLRRFMAETLKAGKGHRPFIHSHLVEVNGRTATGWLTLDVRLASREMEITSSGYYEDEYEKIGGDWKIKLRKTFFVATGK